MIPYCIGEEALPPLEATCRLIAWVTAVKTAREMKKARSISTFQMADAEKMEGRIGKARADQTLLISQDTYQIWHVPEYHVGGVR